MFHFHSDSEVISHSAVHALGVHPRMGFITELGCGFAIDVTQCNFTATNVLPSET